MTIFSFNSETSDLLHYFIGCLVNLFFLYLGVWLHLWFICSVILEVPYTFVSVTSDCEVNVTVTFTESCNVYVFAVLWNPAASAE